MTNFFCSNARFLTVLQLLGLFASCLAAPSTALANDPNAAIIRNIFVEIREVFDEPDIGAFYRFVNKIKISTKESVIRRELLFREGERYDPFVIKESERALRALPFVRQISIIPVPDGEFVDLIVTAQDTWTLFPQIGLSVGGGANKASAGIVEGNLLGYGKRFEMFYAEDDDREVIEGVWDDKRLFGSYQRLLVGHFERSDGYRSVVFYGRPFRSLVEKNAWGFNTDFSDTVGRLFANGDERFIFRNRHSEASGRFIISEGVADELLHRFSVGYEYEKDNFKEADADDFDDIDLDPNSVSQDPALLADDREFSGPFIVYERIEPDFISINYIDRFERIQDFNLGNRFSAKVNFAGKAFGSMRDTLRLSVSDSDGWRLSPTAFIRGEIGATSRLDRSGLSNSIVRGEVKFFDALGSKYINDFFIGKHTIAAALSIDYSEDLDRDREFLLGADRGLRGYDSRTFTGDKRVIANLENRVHVFEDVLRIVNIGAAVFVDAGGTTDQHFGDIFSDNFYGNVGAGLRFSFPRSSGGTVLRLDVAFPWRDSPDDEDQWEPQLLITSGQIFSSQVRSESLGPEKANISVGLNR